LRGYTVKYPNGLTKNVRLSQTAPVIGESPQTVKTEQSSATAEATAPAPKATDSKVAENGNSEDPKSQTRGTQKGVCWPILIKAASTGAIHGAGGHSKR